MRENSVMTQYNIVNLSVLLVCAIFLFSMRKSSTMTQYNIVHVNLSILLFFFYLLVQHEEELYADANNCTNALEDNYHRDILALRLV